MNAGFSTQILTQKLLKLNNSRQSIETLSHWCVFHYRHCRQVVETWDSEFHSAPQERRVSLLYLANDIVQNSKKDSSRYVNEFWRVIPAALNDVFVNGDDFGRNVVQRLVDIWDDRNIFGSHGQSLKEDYSRRFKELKSKSRKPSVELLEKVISCYKHMVNAHVDEDTLMRKYQVALSFVDNLNNEYENNSILENSNGSGFVEKLQEQHSILRGSIEQFRTSELLRGNLIAYLKEALHEQEFKMEQVRSQIKEAHSRYKKADDLCQKLGIHVARQEPSDHGLRNSGPSEMHGGFAPDSTNGSSFEKGQSSAVMYSQENGGGHEILNGILSSRTTRDNIEQKIEEHSANKRHKARNDVYATQPQSPPPPPPPDAFQQPPPPPDAFQQPLEPSTSPPPPPTSDPPPVPPPPPITGAFMPVPTAPFAGLPVPAGPMTAVPFPSGYPVFPPLNYPMVNMPTPFPSPPNPPPGFQGLGGPFYGPPFPTPPPPPMNRK
ncbi:hypothetical protein ABZP36_026779 [Zizania latifolia]